MNIGYITHDLIAWTLWSRRALSPWLELSQELANPKCDLSVTCYAYRGLNITWLWNYVKECHIISITWGTHDQWNKLEVGSTNLEVKYEHDQ